MGYFLNLVVSLFFFFSVLSSQAGTFKLAWDAPTTNTDGTPVTDLSGYKVYESYTSGIYSVVETSVPANVLTTNVSFVDAPISWIGNNYSIIRSKTDFTITFDASSSTNINTYFAVTAYNVDLVESEWSSEFIWTSSAILQQYYLSWGVISNQLTNTISIGAIPALTVERNALPHTKIYARPLAVYVDGRTNLFSQTFTLHNKKIGKPKNVRAVP